MSKHVAIGLCLKDAGKIISEQSILLVCEKTSHPNDPKNPWRWQLPGGKCCDHKLTMENCCKEKPEETAVREFMEETGFAVKIEKFLFNDELLNQESREKFRRYLYLVKIVGGETLQNKIPGGGTSPRWFKIGGFPRNSFTSHQELISRYFKNYIIA